MERSWFGLVWLSGCVIVGWIDGRGRLVGVRTVGLGMWGVVACVTAHRSWSRGVGMAVFVGWGGVLVVGPRLALALGWRLRRRGWWRQVGTALGSDGSRFGVEGASLVFGMVLRRSVDLIRAIGLWGRFWFGVASPLVVLAAGHGVVGARSGIRGWVWRGGGWADGVVGGGGL